LIGTIINVATVLVGGGLGVAMGARLPERMRETVMHGLGLVTLVVGIDLALGTQNILIPMGSVLVGAILGEWLRIDLGLERLSERLRQRVSRRLKHASMAHFTEGFITASLVFCVGPLTVLGSIQDGLSGDYSLLAIKSMLDGFAALAFASSLGVGVLSDVAGGRGATSPQRCDDRRDVCRGRHHDHCHRAAAARSQAHPRGQHAPRPGHRAVGGGLVAGVGRGALNDTTNAALSPERAALLCHR